MGKKVKKLINKAKKITEKFDPLGAGVLNPYVDGLSDQFLGTDWSGAKAAQSEAQRQQQQLLENLRQTMDDNAQQLQSSNRNANVDLAIENVPDTEIGGTANSLSTGAKDGKKKKPVGGVASSLGLNV
jgi:hypothetical protein